MKTSEDEAFDDIARRQGAWGGGFQAKRQAAMDKINSDFDEEYIKYREAFPKGYTSPQPAQEPNTITFSAKADWVMRITADRRIEVNEGVEVTEAAKKVLEAMQWMLTPVQEPVGWQTMEAKYPSLEKLDIRMGDGSILCDVWPQSDGDLWWEGSGTGEKFIDPKYANVTHWRIHAKHITPPQREWVGLTGEDFSAIKFPAEMLFPPEFRAGARWAEAKLKDKNT